MFKKFLALLLTAVILVGAAMGCSVNVDSGPGKEPGNTEPITQETGENFSKVGYPIVKEPITVTAMHPASTIEGNAEEMSYWKKLEEVTNIHIEWERVPGDNNGVQLWYAAGNLTDFIHYPVTADIQYKYGVEGGRFADVSGLIYEYMPNMVSWFKEFPEAEKAIRQINGAIYTMPRIQKGSTSARGQLFYRTDYLEKVNLKTPTTVDEFYNVLSSIKNAGLTQGYAPLVTYTSGHIDSQLELLLFAAFGDSTEPDFGDDGTGKVVYNRTSEQYKRYLEFMNKLFKEGLLENELFTIDTATITARIKAGQAAFMTSAHFLLEEDFEDGKIHLDCLAPLTSEYTSIKKVRAYPYVTTYGGAINKDSKYVKEILRMFDINYAREEVVQGSGLYCLSQALGLEGVDWEYTNKEKTAYKINAPEDWNESIWDYVTKYVGWNQYYSAHILMATSGTGNNLARELGMMKNNIPYAVPEFPDSLMKYTSEESNAMANKLTDINSYVKQARAQFITGVEPLSNWDAYVAEIEKMGIKEVLEIKQKAYDRWNED